MTRVAYLLLCHRDPEKVIAQARMLIAAGDAVALHYDGRADDAGFARIRAALADEPRVAFAARRIRCGWGEWSLVAATLQAVRAALAAFPDASHFLMLSGDCAPIKSAAQVHARLAAEDVDHIESVDFYRSGWVQTGIRDERLHYRFWVNERRHKWLFYQLLAWQKRLGLRREVPRGLEMMIGSQWWCLRRATLETILAFIAARPDVVRFFRTVWIPDESFFQTLVRHLVPEREIRSRTLTFLMFTDYGMPVTFHNDHYDYLLAQDYLFARKISPYAGALRQRLAALFAGGATEPAATGDGRALHRFVVARGRVGRRFAPRAWEEGATLGRGRELMILTCKKWHLGRRLAERISEVTGLTSLGYLFDEDGLTLPDLGGIESDRHKRGRHRRALLRVISEVEGARRLLILLDPARLDVLRDLASDQAQTRVLQVETGFTDGWLVGHAGRVGLLSEGAPASVQAQLLPMLRDALAEEAQRIRDAGLPGHAELHAAAPRAANLHALQEFLGIPVREAGKILDFPDLLTD